MLHLLCFAPVIALLYNCSGVQTVKLSPSAHLAANNTSQASLKSFRTSLFFLHKF